MVECLGEYFCTSHGSTHIFQRHTVIFDVIAALQASVHACQQQCADEIHVWFKQFSVSFCSADKITETTTILSKSETKHHE